MSLQCQHWTLTSSVSCCSRMRLGSTVGSTVGSWLPSLSDMCFSVCVNCCSSSQNLLVPWGISAISISPIIVMCNVIRATCWIHIYIRQVLIKPTLLQRLVLTKISLCIHTVWLLIRAHTILWKSLKCFIRHLIGINDLIVTNVDSDPTM